MCDEAMRNDMYDGGCGRLSFLVLGRLESNIET